MTTERAPPTGVALAEAQTSSPSRKPDGIRGGDLFIGAWS